MLLLGKTGNLIFYLGIVVCCIGSVYVLGYSNLPEFKYAAGIGLIMLAFGVLVFSKRK